MFKLEITAKTAEELKAQALELSHMLNPDRITSSQDVTAGLQSMHAAVDVDDEAHDANVADALKVSAGSNGNWNAPEQAPPVAPFVPPTSPAVFPVAFPAGDVSTRTATETVVAERAQFATVPTFANPQYGTPDVPAGPLPERDSQGFPWDARIHSVSKAICADGTWRTRRNLDPGVKQQVEAELRARGTHQVQTAPPPVQAPVAAPVQHVAQPQYDAFNIPQTTKPAHTFETFKANFVPTMAELINQKKIDQNYLNELKKHFGIVEIWDILRNEESTRALFDTFVSIGLITRVG